MSYSVDMWNSYELVSNGLQLHLRGLRDFITLLKDKHSSEISNANAHYKIYNSNLAITTLESLYEGIKGFKTDMNNQYNYTTEFCTSLYEEMIQPSTKLFDEYTVKVSKMNNEMNQMEKEYLSSVDQTEKARVRFHTAAKESEINMLRCEASKLNLTMPQDVKSKNEKKAQENLKIAKEMEKSYIMMVNQSNEYRDDYIEMKRTNLNQCQEMEETLGEFIKDALRKYIVFQVSYLRNMQYDIERKAKLMESINIKNDIKKVIEKYSSDDLPPYKLEFIPYMSDYESSKKELDSFPLQEDSKKSIRQFISNVFFSEPPTNILNKTQTEIELIVASLYQCKPITIPLEAKKLISQFIHTKKTRRSLLKSINQMRLKGIFTLSSLSYEAIGDIFIECLDVIAMDNVMDFESLRFCLNLSQTLYKAATEPNKPRVFIQTYVKKHPIWKNIKIWKDLIKNDIINEQHNQKSYNIYKEETIEEKGKRIEGIVKASMNSFLYNMISFEVNGNMMKEIIDDYAMYYDITGEDRKEFDEIVVDYEKIKNQKEAALKEEIIEQAKIDKNKVDNGVIIQIISDKQNAQDDLSLPPTQENH